MEVAMKLKYIIGTAALSLILAGTAYPQQEQEKEKPQQQEQKPAEKPKTQQKQEQQSAKQQQGEQKQEPKNEQKQEKQSARQQSEQPKQSEQRTDDRDKHSDHGHGRIPEDRFRASFGREHHFRVEHVDNRRFHYGGFWFTFNDVWPAAWLYTDDFYIDYIDGQYYLIDLTHPGIQLLLVVE